MSWAYTAWASQDTTAQRLAMLRLHITEVSASVESAVDAVSSDGKSMTRPQRLQYLTTLLAERDKLEGKASGTRSGGRSYARIVRPS